MVASKDASTKQRKQRSWYHDDRVWSKVNAPKEKWTVVQAERTKKTALNDET